MPSVEDFLSLPVNHNSSCVLEDAYLPFFLLVGKIYTVLCSYFHRRLLLQIFGMVILRSLDVLSLEA